MSGTLTQPTTQPTIADALFPRVRQRVLGLLFGNPARSFFTNEVVALVKFGTGAVQRELAFLAEAGLLTVRVQGNQKHYQANAKAPVFEELRGLVLKTTGIVDVLRAALEPAHGRIAAAFVFGSIPSGQAHAGSDVDLLVLSDDLGHGELFALLEPATTQLGRTVNPTLYAPADWKNRLNQANAFASRVMQGPKLWVIGSEDDARA